MQPKIVNYKVNQHLYSLRLLLSSISFLSFFPSSLSSSQGKAYLYIFTLLPVSLLIPSCITSLPSGIFSVSFKSFLRIIIIIFSIKVCFEWKAYPTPPTPSVSEKQFCWKHNCALSYWETLLPRFEGIPLFYHFLCCAENFSWRFSFCSSAGIFPFLLTAFRFCLFCHYVPSSV